MRDIRLRLTDLWLTAMNPRTRLDADERLHIEHILGNEYRMTTPIEPTRTERATDDQKAA